MKKILLLTALFTLMSITPLLTREEARAKKSKLLSIMKKVTAMVKAAKQKSKAKSRSKPRTVKKSAKRTSKRPIVKKKTSLHVKAVKRPARARSAKKSVPAKPLRLVASAVAAGQKDGAVARMFKRGSPGPREGLRSSSPTRGPVRHVALKSKPRLISPPGSPTEDEAKLRTKSGTLAKKRKQRFDQTAMTLIDHERMSSMPTSFCLPRGRCYRSYQELQRAIYKPGKSLKSDSYSPPLFCVPARTGGKWDYKKASCHTDWRDTVQGCDKGECPPYACLGHPNLTGRLAALPAGGKASGFICRNRIFQVYDYPPIASKEDQKSAIAGMCKDMRTQVWGKEIAGSYKPAGSPAVVEVPPKLRLSREELLYFYGHKNFYCRADRPLTHRSKNKDWAQSFTCGVPRGVIESGPFEEGVQACAISPYSYGLGYTMQHKEAESLKRARLHCWKFNRPTCEELAGEDSKSEQEKLDALYSSNVFDFFDAYREVRRTGSLSVLSYKDLKEVEKIPEVAEKYAFSDTANDEGSFGIDEFCRFAGNTKRLVCGYNRKTMAQHYELHQAEGGQSSGCSDGICDRGAFERGYYCGVFTMKEYFKGKPVWVCGIDMEGRAGRDMVKGVKAVCVGGKHMAAFVSPKGERTTLQCYERKFIWAEDRKSGALLKLNVGNMLERAQKSAGQGAAYLKFYYSKAKAAKVTTKNLETQLKDRLLVLVRKFKSTKGPLGKILNKMGAALEKRIISGIKKDLVGTVQKEYDKAMAEVRKYKASLGKISKMKKKKHPVFLKKLMNKVVDTAAAATKRKLKDAEETVKDLKDMLAKAKEVAKHKKKGSTSKQVKDVRQRHQREVRDFFAANAKSLIGFLGHRTAARLYFVDQKMPRWLSDLKGWAGRVKTGSNQRGAADLVQAIVHKERAADDGWMQEFLLAAKDPDKPLGYAVDDKYIEKAILQHMATKLLDAFRGELFAEARKYAKAVMASAERLRRSKDLLTRAELLERADKAAVYCVAPRFRGRLGPYYVCASSPLMVTGDMDSFAENLANTAYGRFFRDEPRAFARTLSFSMRPGALERLGALYEESILGTVRQLNTDADEADEHVGMQMSVCWAPYEYLDTVEGEDS